MDEPDLIRTLHELGGVATRAELLASFDRSVLDAAVAGGQLNRIARGRYAAHNVDAARVAARSTSGVLSGLSAAQWWGWSVKWPPRKPVVTVPRNRALRPADLDVRRRDLPKNAVFDGFVLTRAHTVVDCARSLPFDEALSVADSALRDPRVERADLLTLAASSPRTGRTTALRVVELADGRAANPFESCVRAIALDVRGLHVQPQLPVDNIGWADLVDERLRIVIECDSWAYHSGEDQFRHDVRRYTDMVRRGWLVVRFVWEDAMSRPDRVRQALLDVVAIRAGES